jgi:hypothetical protein
MSGDAITAIGAVLIASGVTAFSIFLYLAIAANERPIVATLPLVEEQWVTFDAPGLYNLHGDTGGTFSPVFLGLRYTLQAPDGTQLPGYRPGTRGVNGVILWRFNVPAAGSYYLRVWRLSERNLAPYKLSFARVLPFKGWRYIGGTAIGVLCTLAGLVMLVV